MDLKSSILIATLLAVTGCGFIEVTVHQSVRQADPLLGTNSTSTLELVRGDDLSKAESKDVKGSNTTHHTNSGNVDTDTKIDASLY